MNKTDVFTVFCSENKKRTNVDTHSKQDNLKKSIKTDEKSTMVASSELKSVKNSDSFVKADVDNNKVKNKKIGFWTNLKGVTLGYLGALMPISILSGGVNLALFEILQEQSKGLSANDVQKINNKAWTIMEETGLLDKGIFLQIGEQINMDDIERFAGKQPFESLTDRPDKQLQGLTLMLEQLNEDEIFDKLSFEERLSRQLRQMIGKDAKNAAYVDELGRIYVPADGKLATSVFHEVGHAMNFNGSTFSRALSKLYPLHYLGIPLLLVSLFKHKKQEGEKANGFWDKTTTFVKNNVGKLTFCAWIPCLLEETRASLNANKIIKNHLSKDLIKRVNKGNIAAGATYFVAAILSSVGAMLAVKLKDKITDKAIAKKNKNIEER